MVLASRASCSLTIAELQGVRGAQPRGIAGGPPVLQGVRGAQPPGIAGGPAGAAPWHGRGVWGLSARVDNFNTELLGRCHVLRDIFFYSPALIIFGISYVITAQLQLHR